MTKLVLPCVIVLFFDQLSKYMVSHFIPKVGSIRILGEYARIVYTRNPGAVFGIPVGISFPYLVGIACIILLILSVRMRSSVLSLILGGAIGNLIDRIRFGSVVDFIDIGVGNIRWPTFNIADSCITVGIIIIIIAKFKQRQRE